MAALPTEPDKQADPTVQLAYNRQKAVDDALQAAILAWRRKITVYTEGPARWDGIAHNHQARHGECPRYADCSGFVTWCLWNALKVGFNYGDSVNGERWQDGYTGTMLEHGRVVSVPEPGDAVIYGTDWPGVHTAIFTGGGLVVSHGTSAGPLLRPWRLDGEIPVLSIRRYL
jgi:cell wall-associated NlpC family hydrolase